MDARDSGRESADVRVHQRIGVIRGIRGKGAVVIMLRNTGAVIVGMVVAAGAAAHGQQRYDPPQVPTNLVVSSDYKLPLVGHALGTQNYICGVTQNGAIDWVFTGPQATLFDTYGRQIATHFLSKNPWNADALQATWQHSGDTSAAWAVRRDGSMDSRYVAGDAIEWLLLEVRGSQPGPFGGEKLNDTKLIQRVNTERGQKPPTSECTPSNFTARRNVYYEADYYFYK